MKFSIVWTAAVTLLIVSVSLAQSPEPVPRHDKFRDDPHAFCRKGPNDADDPSAHSCACELMCSEGANAVHQQQLENPQCELYCEMSRCACYPDNPCDKPKLDFYAK